MIINKKSFWKINQNFLIKEQQSIILYKVLKVLKTFFRERKTLTDNEIKILWKQLGLQKIKEIYQEGGSLSLF